MKQVRDQVIVREIGDRLLDHLELIKLAPKVIVDVGCGAGYCARQLAKRYPKAQILGFEVNEQLLNLAKKQKPWFSRQKYSLVDNWQLPLAESSVDLVLANMTLLGTEKGLALFKTAQRILSKNGVFLFSSLGPGCLQEDHDRLIDMHHLGDQAVQANLLDPVIESETITFIYDDVDAAKQDLASNGLGFLNRPGLEQRFEVSDDGYALPLEVIYGHAWGSDTPAGVVKASNGVAEVPLTMVSKRG